MKNLKCNSSPHSKSMFFTCLNSKILRKTITVNLLGIELFPYIHCNFCHVGPPKQDGVRNTKKVYFITTRRKRRTWRKSKRFSLRHVKALEIILFFSEGIAPLINLLGSDNPDVREGATLALANITTSNNTNCG